MPDFYSLNLKAKEKKRYQFFFVFFSNDTYSWKYNPVEFCLRFCIDQTLHRSLLPLPHLLDAKDILQIDKIYYIIFQFLVLTFYSNRTVVGDYINVMKTTFNFNLIYIKLLKSRETQKHGKKEKLAIKKASL